MTPAHRMMGRALAGGLAVFAAVLAADPAAGLANEAYVNSYPPIRARAQITLEGSSSADDAIVSFDDSAGRYLVTNKPTVTARDGCVPVDSTTASCERFDYPDLHDRFVVALNRGDDTFRMRIPWRRGSFDGEKGDDTIIGSAADSVLYGGSGQDVLKGRGGDDVILGLNGHDRLRGGSGDDRLRADDDDRDRLIDCGPGDDKAFIDAIDPEPRHCERVRVVAAREWSRSEKSNRSPD